MKKIIGILVLVVLVTSTFTMIACNQHTHNYVSALTTYPTCTSDGIRTYTCDCGERYTEPVAKDTSLHDYNVTQSVDATETTAGYKVHVCKHCGDTYTETIPATGQPTAHVCQSQCQTCGKCANTSCLEGVCQNKCSGHDIQGGDTPVKVFIVGDSTICNYDMETDKAFPRNGYGMWLDEYFNQNVTIVNLALSGRSSKDFLTKSEYTTLTSSIASGDYLIIDFGHNDEKSDDATRYTNPTGDTTDQTSFQYYLYTYYVKMALDVGAQPILCTPIVRRNTDNNYNGSSGHVTNGGDYAQAIIDLGAQYDIPVVNLRDLTKQLYLSLSSSETAKMHATTDKVEANVDNTHLNSYGAAQVAYMFCNALLNTDSDLAKYVDQSKLVPPVYDNVIVKNVFDQPQEGDITVYGKWEITNYQTYCTANHQGLNLVYHSAGMIVGKVVGGVGYAKANDSAGNGSVTDGVISTEKGYLEFVPTADGVLTLPIKNATTKTLYINSINNETDRVVVVGSFLAGLENQSGDGYAVTIGADTFTLTLTVKYGYTYRVAIHGSKMQVYDCEWMSGSSGGDDTPPAEEQTPSMDLTATNQVVVMLDGDYTNADLSKLQLQAYNSDFYSLNYKLDQTLTIVNYKAELIDGKTKVTFTVAESVYGIYVADHFATPTYDSAKIATIIQQATYAVTWQLDNGGWDKDYALHVSRAWDGSESKITKGWKANGKDLGTIDNDATYSEMRLIAQAHKLSTDATQKQAFLDSFNKAFAFLQNLQYQTGGFAQVYPRRNNYSDNVTFNDNAMISVMKLLQDISIQKYPFDQGGIVDSSTRQLAESMLQKGVDYILESQIVVGGVKTAWCAQHHPTTYQPVKARAYEHPSISGSESVEIAKFLLTQVNNAKAQTAAQAAIAYLDSVKLENYAYDNNTHPYIIASEGSTIWYRFYEIGTNKGIFSDMSGEIKYDITQIDEERRTGYSWCVDTPKKLLRVYAEVGYYANKVVVVASAKISGDGCSIDKGEIIDVQVPTQQTTA